MEISIIIIIITLPFNKKDCKTSYIAEIMNKWFPVQIKLTN